ncbi:MAG: ABC transporter ATP-binding protein, partial [Clostridia bacterium]|nr:ABC transporter ATP-binding protein [Clostridia bacterium]
MDKHNSEKAATRRNENEQLRRTNKIPDVEWLFDETGKKSKNKQGDSKFISKLFRWNWGKVLYSTLVYLLQASPLWVMPLITSDVIDMITYRPDGYLWRILVDGVILTIVILQNVLSTTWRSSITNKLIRTTTAQIRAGLVRKLQRLSITYHKEMEEGRIQSKFLRDIENVDGYYRNYLMAFVPNLVGSIVSAAIAIWRSPIVSLFFAAIIPLNVLLTKAFGKRISRDNSLYRQENEKLSSKLTTALQMLTLTKAHGLISTEEHQIKEKIDYVTKAGLRLDKTTSIFGSMMWTLSQLMAAICLFFCVFLAIKE